ncbi:pyroglutamylated RF-amide peptide receptor isoform X2 [Pseudorasbora parva]|uniref:pyroglutamylated RF-amide peptide receptor isoform X2 n=1 Tax=Pseudorasbora parva TaxID=51549 RepID=UPI00351F5C24
MSSPTEMTATTKITPEVLQELLQYYNLSRQEFIDTYDIRPLVYIPELPAGAKTTFVVMYAIIFVLALVGNSLVVYVVARKRATRTATTVFICSLAVSDLLITFFCIPFTLLQNISSEWLGGLVWIAAVMVGSPMLFVQQLEVKYDFLYDHHHVCCQERWHSLAHRQVYSTFIMVALFLLPLAAMLLLYSRIGIELWIRKRVGDSSVLSTMNHREISKISRKKKRAVKMMITIVLLFTICWAPFHIVHMLFEYNDLEKNYDEVTVNMIIAVVQAIGFSNSFNNPIVYAFMNENFKKSCVATLSSYLRRPGHQGGAVPRPHHSVHFSKHLKTEAFGSNTTSGNNHNPHSHQNRVLSSSHGDLEISTAFAEQKVETASSQLPSASSCVK